MTGRALSSPMTALLAGSAGISRCPFCGPYSGDKAPQLDQIDLGIYAVCCPVCRCIGPHQDGAQSPETAIARWNKRAKRA